MSQPRSQADAARRTSRLIVRTTNEEDALLRRAADEAGLTVSEHVRRRLFGVVVEQPRESAFGASVAHQLRRIGVNINQLTAIAHLNGELPPDLVRLWSKLETLLDLMLGRMDSRVDDPGDTDSS